MPAQRDRQHVLPVPQQVRMDMQQDLRPVRYVLPGMRREHGPLVLPAPPVRKVMSARIVRQDRQQMQQDVLLLRQESSPRRILRMMISITIS